MEFVYFNGPLPVRLLVYLHSNAAPRHPIRD